MAATTEVEGSADDDPLGVGVALTDGEPVGAGLPEGELLGVAEVVGVGADVPVGAEPEPEPEDPVAAEAALPAWAPLRIALLFTGSFLGPRSFGAAGAAGARYRATDSTRPRSPERRCL